eukprot:CAMPEP_0172674350 /NCGR_PEP_ID=MMETSP1074-20121228/12686_1 /TAXON_ID=2916 /ORGANISM="Ceratium fusus, Strain PA161109" /LENGTH=419 /DNA_ID=CAMNT_0013491749 /DNA_START=33 /DNA_END=1292 /DNA_ORIENTATION=+
MVQPPIEGSSPGRSARLPSASTSSPNCGLTRTKEVVPLLAEAPGIDAGYDGTIKPSHLIRSANEIAVGATAWNASKFSMVKNLQDAVRNHGRVDLMRRKERFSNGSLVAVKRMPTGWVMTSQKEFDIKYPTSSEKPWFDMSLVRHLNSLRYPFLCDFIGLYRDYQATYVVSSFASEGDLFSWCDNHPPPGLEREAVMLPLIRQIFDAVRWLHNLGVAHRDLSLENILLHDAGGGDLQIRLIDFGMSTLQRMCPGDLVGKASYQAPEMHSLSGYDGFAADDFSVGVVVFAMASQDYPWASTKQGNCQLFEYVRMFGLRKFLERRRLRKGVAAGKPNSRLIEVFSPALVDLVEGLLQLEVTHRWTLGEDCYATDEGRKSAIDSEWMKQGSRKSLVQKLRLKKIANALLRPVRLICPYGSKV